GSGPLVLSPLDDLKRADIPADQLKAAGFGDPAQAPADLVAIYGKPDEKSGWGGNLKFALGPHDRALAFVTGGRQRIQFIDPISGKLGGSASVDDAISALAYSPDGKTFATADLGNAVRLWSTHPASEQAKLTGHKHPLRALAFNADGRTLASGDAGGGVMLWDVATRTAKSAIPDQTATITALAFSPDHKLLAILGLESMFNIWDLDAGREYALKLHDTSGNHVAACFSPSGKVLYGSTSGGLIRSWNIASGERREIASINGINVTAIAVHPSGQMLASVQHDGTARLWDLTKKKLNAELKRWQLGPSDGKFGSVAFDSTGKYLLTGNANGTIYVLRLNLHASTAPSAPSAKPAPAKVEPATASSPFDALKRADIAAEQLKRAGLGDPSKAPAELVAIVGTAKDNPWGNSNSRVAMDPMSREFVMTVGAARVIRFLKPECKSAGEISDLPDRAQRLVYSPDGKLLAIGLAAAQKTIKVFAAESGAWKEKYTLAGHTSGIWALAFTSDSQTLVSASSIGDLTIRLWDMGTGQERVVITRKDPATTLSLTPDGKLLATGPGSNDKAIRFYDVATGKEAGTPIETNGGLPSIAFSPDGRAIASGSTTGYLRIWNLASGKAVGARLDVVKILWIAYRPDGAVLAVACADGSVRLCDSATGGEIKRLQLGPPDGLIDELAYDATGRYLLTANGNQTVYVMRLE
ncbi:MAG TPA: WD40 repeat domain-containing protein, partial [Pirellulales bacterium]|nr:WD40 repeat domain-containing protein [Pirellulales bacterium]